MVIEMPLLLAPRTLSMRELDRSGVISIQLALAVAVGALAFGSPPHYTLALSAKITRILPRTPVTLVQRYAA
jgi:small neutral amino acid transporter SnatA (MarC family)